MLNVVLVVAGLSGIPGRQIKEINMPGERILVIEDEEDIQELIRFNLDKEGYKVNCRATGEEGLKSIELKTPDLVLLDIMLPGIDGFAVCRKIRNQESLKSIPVIMLTSKSAEGDVVTGLECGADDYMAKPFSPKVLLARVKALLRRSSGGGGRDENLLIRGDIEIDNLHHEVRISGETVDLTLTEYRVLELLAKRPGVVFSRYQIVDAVKGEDYPVTDRSVDVQIVGLRKKLKGHSQLIQTVRGVGYRFAAEW